MRTMIGRVAVAVTMAAGTLVAVSAPAGAIPKGTHGFHTAKSGLGGVHGWGTFKRGTYGGKKTAVVYAKIKDTSRKDGLLAALQIQFRDHRWSGNDVWTVWNPKNVQGRVAEVSVQSYYLDELLIRECKGTQYRKNGKRKFRTKKCGGWRLYYRGTKIVG